MDIRKAAVKSIIWFAAFVLLFMAIEGGRLIASDASISDKLFLSSLLRMAWVFSLVAVIIPVPHILFSLIFEERRNLVSALGIASAWHKWIVLVYGIGWAFLLTFLRPLAYL